VSGQRRCASFLADQVAAAREADVAALRGYRRGGAAASTIAPDAAGISCSRTERANRLLKSARPGEADS